MSSAQPYPLEATTSETVGNEPGAKASTDRLLSLASTPMFAALALLAGVHGSGTPPLLGCDASLLTGMVPMCLLTSPIHLAPWLKLISIRQ